MLSDSPFFLVLFFLIITVSALMLLYSALKTIGRRTAIGTGIALVIWGVFQSTLAYTGYYRHLSKVPPRIFLTGLAPIAVVLLFVLIYPPIRKRLIKINIEALTWIHIIRIPVELSLLWLFLVKLIPEQMTFEGKNFDILSGLTAPFVIFYGIRKRKVNRIFLLWWNIACLLLLLSIIVISMLSAPFVFQQIGLQQPNVAIFYFPFVLLPTLIVPIVLFAQLVAIIRLAGKRKKAVYERRTYNATL